MASRPFAAGDPVAIIGNSGEWYGVEHAGNTQKTAFVHSKHVKLT